ncbi:MAG: septum formation initiator family protein [bacterium]|nr:septum formation initiator family protein [bacterium]MCM1374472.1 septum formation initiator family protein [Muribaculum sp.]
MAERRGRRRKAVYRKKVQNRFSMFLVMLALLMILVAVYASSIKLQGRLDDLQAQSAALQVQIDAERQREQEIELLRKRSQTKEYYEEIAKEKLGLVNPDEIVFKSRD